MSKWGTSAPDPSPVPWTHTWIQDTTHNHANTRAQIHVTTKAAHERLKMKRRSRSLQRCPDSSPLSSLWGIASKQRRMCFQLKHKLVNPADNAENSRSSSCFLLSPEEDVGTSSQLFTAKSIISPWQETGNCVFERRVCAGERNRWSLWELITCQRLKANTVNWVTNTYETDWAEAHSLACFVFY